MQYLTIDIWESKKEIRRKGIKRGYRLLKYVRCKINNREYMYSYHKDDCFTEYYNDYILFTYFTLLDITEINCNYEMLNKNKDFKYIKDTTIINDIDTMQDILILYKYMRISNFDKIGYMNRKFYNDFAEFEKDICKNKDEFERRIK